MKLFSPSEQQWSPDVWRRYVSVFIACFSGLLASAYLFILLLDPFGVSHIALPLNRALVTVQRYMYPQIIRSRHFDSIIVGTSTSMLLNPENLNGPFRARFANVAMASATAWEQTTLIELFLREVRHPKVLVVGLDVVWCDPGADRNRITFRGFPEWLYDDNRWNDYLHLLNRISFMSAVRLLRFNLGLYAPTTRSDGMDTFLPPEEQYDLQQARHRIYGGRAWEPASDGPAPPFVSENELEEQEFPALSWLDEILTKLPSDTFKVLAFMPVHVSNETRDRAFDTCKARIAEIGRRRGATVLDWRISSTITREDSNYWDALHYRVPIANRIAHDLASAVLLGKKSDDRTYDVLVH
jgi:hypothetical protein